jgi:hypothetical protein
MEHIHEFSIDDAVDWTGAPRHVARGNYRVARLLPQDMQGHFQYRIRSDAELTERVVCEDEIRATQLHDPWRISTSHTGALNNVDLNEAGFAAAEWDYYRGDEYTDNASPTRRHMTLSDAVDLALKLYCVGEIPVILGKHIQLRGIADIWAVWRWPGFPPVEAVQNFLPQRGASQ